MRLPTKAFTTDSGMMGRGRRFSTTSVDEAEAHGHKVEYSPETEALRPAAKSVHPDDYPCFVLEDTTVYLQDRKTIANLLNAELQGPFLVRGRLVVDGDLLNRLFSKNSNGQYIQITKCESFSIGDNPITLWALGQSGWLEIQPSEVYCRTYNQMTEAISIFYFVTDLYERERQKRKGSKSSPVSIDNILLKYAIHEGTGLVRSEAAEKIKSHAQFLLSQMRKVDFDWQTTQLFKWLSTECHDIYTQLLEKTGETILPSTRIPLAELSKPEPQISPPPEPQRTQTIKPEILPHRSRASHPPTRSTSTLGLPSESPSLTPPPNILPETCDPLTAILSLLRAPKLDIRGWSPLERMTFSKLGTLFYYAYTIKGEPVSQEIIRLYASSIVPALDEKWTASPMYAQLKEAATNPTPMTENKRSAKSVTEVKRRVNKNVNNRSATPMIRHSERQEAHGSKSLFPPQSGRRSGKQARLRLAPSQAMKRVERAESESNDSWRPRKKRRPSPPEMGDDSDSNSFLPALVSMPIDLDSEIDDEDSLPETRPLVTLKVVTEALPTLSPSGPNGAWVCDCEDCVFVVRDTESEDGKESIRKHFHQHAELLEREVLARQEAGQRRLPIEHLLEKLRSIGEESRLEGMREVIGGRLVPEPIKRARGLAV